MSQTLRNLYTEDDNPFKLQLLAGRNGYRNAVTWVYMIEDDSIIHYFRGSELAVTTGIKTAEDPQWLGSIVRELCGRGAAGLIVNTGKYILEIPQDVRDFCDREEFPLLTMPWEISVTDMLQSFCTRIIQEQQDSALFDKALDDAVHRRGNREECQEILSRYYDLEGSFNVFTIRTGQIDEDIRIDQSMEYRLINRLRRHKTIHSMREAKFGLLTKDNYQLMVMNNVERKHVPELLDIILDVYREAAKAGELSVGVGVEVRGLDGISKSYLRAQTAMRMAAYRHVPYVRFEEMGFYRILFSVKEEDILYAYANELLAPLEGEGAKSQGYLELLKAYIENDRSLERTAEALYLHRNTVNYRLQKIKSLLNSPLKTAEDLFPFQLALAIRDIETSFRRGDGQKNPS